MFGRATIRLGIGPHSSFACDTSCRSSLTAETTSDYGYSVVYWAPWEMHCNSLGLALGLGLVTVSSRTSWVVNFVLYRY